MGVDLKQTYAALTAEAKELTARLALVNSTKESLAALLGIAGVPPPKPTKALTVPTRKLPKGAMNTHGYILRILQDGPLPVSVIAQRIWEDGTVVNKPQHLHVLKVRVSAGINKLRLRGQIKNTPDGWTLTGKNKAKVVEPKSSFKPLLGARAFNGVYRKLNRDRSSLPTGRLVTAILKHRRMSVASIAAEIWKDKRIKSKPATEKMVVSRVGSAVCKLRRDGLVKLTPQGWMLVRKAKPAVDSVADTTQQPVEHQVQ